MSISARAAAHPLRDAQTVFAAERLAFNNRLFKLVGAIMIAVCFWYAVPYKFPLQLDPDPMMAAANEAAAYEGNLSRQIAMPVVLLVSAYSLFRLPKAGRFLPNSKLMGVGLSYVVWAILSLAWSGDPTITGKRLLVFAIDGFFMVTLACVASMREIALFGFFITGAVALIALCADSLVSNSFAPLNPDYRFMGVMTAKHQAMNLFVGLVCGLTVAQGSPRTLRRLAPLLALFATLLFLTRARIGTFLCAATFLFVALRVARPWFQAQGRAVALLAALTILLPAIAFAVMRSGQGALESVFMMGRHDTENTASLSNRAPLWRELLHSVVKHPILGLGFEAFWSPQQVKRVSANQGWVVPHAHNIYLDQTASLGLIRCCLYSGMLFGAWSLARQRYGRYPDEVSLLLALLLSWLALLNCTESIFVAPYLPTLIAYACIVKRCMLDVSEQQGTGDPRASEGQPRGVGWPNVRPPRCTYSSEVRR